MPLPDILVRAAADFEWPNSGRPVYTAFNGIGVRRGGSWKRPARSPATETQERRRPKAALKLSGFGGSRLCEDRLPTERLGRWRQRVGMLPPHLGTQTRRA